MLAGSAANLRADTRAASPTGGYALGFGYTFSLGHSFTLSSAANITQLGFYDYRGDGLASNVPVAIYDGTGTAPGRRSFSVYGGTTNKNRTIENSGSSQNPPPNRPQAKVGNFPQIAQISAEGRPG